MRTVRTRPALAAMLIVAASVFATAGAGHAEPEHQDHSARRTEDNGGIPDPSIMRQIKDIRHVTARYHSVHRALRDGYAAFAIPPAVGGTPTSGRGLPGDPTCFDNPSGGMGVHYVKGIDGVLDLEHPEALVYAIGRRGRLELVGVEYIVPKEFVDATHPPTLMGQTLHAHPYLPVYVLHAWVWKSNPSGMFADYNPDVGSCSPTSGNVHRGATHAS